MSFGTGCRQEGHPATETLHYLPVMECTFPLLLFLYAVRTCGAEIMQMTLNHFLKHFSDCLFYFCSTCTDR